MLRAVGVGSGTALAARACCRPRRLSCQVSVALVARVSWAGAAAARGRGAPSGPAGVAIARVRVTAGGQPALARLLGRRYARVEALGRGRAPGNRDLRRHAVRGFPLVHSSVGTVVWEATPPSEAHERDPLGRTQSAVYRTELSPKVSNAVAVA